MLKEKRTRKCDGKAEVQQKKKRRNSDKMRKKRRSKEKLGGINDNEKGEEK